MFYVLALLATVVALFATVVVLFPLLALSVFGLVVFSIAVLFLLLPWLAKENILVTKVSEGTARAIMRGNSLDRFVMSFKRHHLNEPGKPWFDPNESDWKVVYHGSDADDDYDDRSWLLKYLGLYWIGWPWRASVYVYQFEWNETLTDRTSGKERVLPRGEATDFIYVADFTYAIVTDEAETKDNLPTDELTLATVAIRNPYRALFSGEDWMRRVTAAINRHVRDFVADQDFEDLQKSEGKAKEEFSAPIVKLNTELPDDKRLPDGSVDPSEDHGLTLRYGVLIRTADLQSIALSGEGRMRHQNATTTKYVAAQEAEAIKLKGQAEAEVITMTGNAEAEALKARLAVIKENGEVGVALAGYDAIRKSSEGPGNTVIWANNPLAAVADMFNKKGGST